MEEEPRRVQMGTAVYLITMVVQGLAKNGCNVTMAGNSTLYCMYVRTVGCTFSRKKGEQRKSKQQSDRCFSMREILEQRSGREYMNNQHVIVMVMAIVMGE